MILVTGGTGFIGSHLLEKLSSSGERVRALVRRSVPLPAGVEPVEGDLVAGTGLDRALEGVDLVLHVAGVTKALTPADYYSGNVRATGNLARAAAGRSPRFVHVSSLAAAGPSTAGAPCDEETPPHPITHYGKSKLEAERVVHTILPEAVIVRPPVVYGPRDTGVLQVLKSVAQGYIVQIAGGERWFSSIFVRDLVDGLMAAARAPQAAGRVYFLSHPEPSSWTQLGETAARIMRRPARSIRIPTVAAIAVGMSAELWSHFTHRAGIVSREKIAEARCPFWTCNPERAANELGFQARTSLEAGLSETLAWYKKAGWLKY